jgi:hypothetical protein
VFVGASAYGTRDGQRLDHWEGHGVSRCDQIECQRRAAAVTLAARRLAAVVLVGGLTTELMAGAEWVAEVILYRVDG